MIAQRSGNSLLAWLDQRDAWQFVGVLYVARWVALAFVVALSHFVFSDHQNAAASIPEGLHKVNAAALFFMLVVISPLIETLVECTLPYFLISRVRDSRETRPNHSWGFVGVSACVMALLHPMLAALAPSLITGAFLAYCYAHFAARNTGQAILATTTFHAGINIVGWTMILMS